MVKDRNSPNESNEIESASSEMAAHMARMRSSGILFPPLFFPSILLLLAEEPSHGYLLSKKLAEAGIVDDKMDPSPIYKILRNLEEWELAVSEHVEEGRGPARKVYQLTDKGREALSFMASRVDTATDLIKWFKGKYKALK